jgi:hypothetical protein
MLAEKKQCFLASHAAAEREDSPPVDPEPGQCAVNNVVHPGEVGDLTAISP